MMRCSRTKTKSSVPTAIFVHQELSVPSKVMMVWMTPSTRTPSTVPRTYPDPPVSSVPPITTAAMASSSVPTRCRL